eukprot:CAMPEP_0115011922 /NCGR_PEP_ID=MMETSP0216-20121206/24380_1 /TAXON_ID=223996 /ORGANISM="Protocruzia adherens, Strain Boccale" /LENGTH=617 /DNA_ID=CAMNT_0002380781 /DNA_START=1073 /DNA_END=2926 /DNA_ORIENTATION=+
MSHFKAEAALRIKRARKLNKQHALSEIGKSSCWLNFKIRRLDKQIASSNKLIRKQHPDLREHEDLPALRAYVTFRTLKAKKKCIKTYHKYNKFRLCTRRKQTHKLRLGGVYKIRVLEAQEPSEILWENLEVTSAQRFGRKLVALILVLTLLMVSTIVVYVIKSYDDEVVDEDFCLQILNKIPSTRSEALVETNLDAVNCWCRSMGWSKLLSDAELINDVCREYALERMRLYGLKIAAGFGVTIINQILKEILQRLSAFQRFHSFSNEQKSLLVTILIAQYLNSAIIPVIVYADLENSALLKHIVRVLPFIEEIVSDEGTISDFTREWYTKVSPAIIMFMFVNIFVPHLLQLIWAPILHCRRKQSWKSQVTQRDLNNLYQGRNFKLSHVYAQSLNTVFIAFTFASGLPILYILAAAALSLQYICNKTFLLRIARKPPHYDESLNARVIGLFPLALLLNLGIGIFMLGNSDVWPLKHNVRKVTRDGDAFIDRNSESDLITSFTGLPLFLALTFTMLYILTRGFVENYARHCKKDKKILPKNVKDFYEELNSIQHNGLRTYNLKANPRYRDVILAMDEFSAEMKSPRRDPGMLFVKRQGSFNFNMQSAEKSSLLSLESQN